jgi:RES domain-containing protein
MEVFRICSEEFSNKLTSSGKPARWNKDNQFVLYTSQSRALATLELIVHKSAITSALTYKMMVITIKENENFYTKKSLKDMLSKWKSIESYSLLQDIGNDWYVNNKSLILQVPSVVIPQEFNYIINTNHPDFKTSISLTKTEDYFWDDRLI